jgi:hypothetical protein
MGEPGQSLRHLGACEGLFLLNHAPLSLPLRRIGRVVAAEYRMKEILDLTFVAPKTETDKMFATLDCCTVLIVALMYGLR